MSLISFIKNAGEKLFGNKDDSETDVDPTAANETASAAILTYINTQNLRATGLNVRFDGATSTATVTGIADDQATKEKILLFAGNVNGVSHVHDNMTVTASALASEFYTVKHGDSLSSISKIEYGNANEYMKIFEANQPMLSNPDKIYPGQVLRIPD